MDCAGWPYHVVTDDIMVPFFREELDREPAHIANGISTALLTTCCAKAPKDWSLLADSIQKFGARVLCDVGIRDFKFAPSTHCLGMDNSVYGKRIGMGSNKSVVEGITKNTNLSGILSRAK